jgi:hypothetical protein
MSPSALYASAIYTCTVRANGYTCWMDDIKTAYQFGAKEVAPYTSKARAVATASPLFVRSKHLTHAEPVRTALNPRCEAFKKLPPNSISEKWRLQLPQCDATRVVDRVGIQS